MIPEAVQPRVLQSPDHESKVCALSLMLPKVRSICKPKVEVRHVGTRYSRSSKDTKKSGNSISEHMNSDAQEVSARRIVQYK